VYEHGSIPHYACAGRLPFGRLLQRSYPSSPQTTLNCLLYRHHTLSAAYAGQEELEIIVSFFSKACPSRPFASLILILKSPANIHNHMSIHEIPLSKLLSISPGIARVETYWDR
jgi:hypothetical protein